MALVPLPLRRSLAESATAAKSPTVTQSAIATRLRMEEGLNSEVDLGPDSIAMGDNSPSTRGR